jgi:hypothetical protein
MIYIQRIFDKLASRLDSYGPSGTRLRIRFAGIPETIRCAERSHTMRSLESQLTKRYGNPVKIAAIAYRLNWIWPLRTIRFCRLIHGLTYVRFVAIVMLGHLCGIEIT